MASASDAMTKISSVLREVMTFTMRCGDVTPELHCGCIVALFSVSHKHAGVIERIDAHNALLKDFKPSNLQTDEFRTMVSELTPAVAAVMLDYKEWHREHGRALHSILYDRNGTVQTLKANSTLAMAMQQIYNLAELWETNLRHIDLKQCRMAVAIAEAAGLVTNGYNLIRLMDMVGAISISELMNFSGTTMEALDRIMAVPTARDIVDADRLRLAFEAKSSLNSASSGSGGSLASLLSSLEQLQSRLESARGRMGSGGNKEASGSGGSNDDDDDACTPN